MSEKLYPAEGPAPKATPITGPLIHKDGIFFGLPEDEYHAALALSASGIKHLRISPENFWASSPMNAERDEDEPEEESFAKTLGRAYHKRIIEGRAAFYAEFAPQLEQSQHPRALVTADQISKRLEELGKPKSGKTKADLIARLIDADPQAEIWDLIVEQYRARFPHHTFLPFKYVKRIEIAAAMIENDPTLGKAFAGGMPEVSIFWHDDNGLPRKARLDYLKTRAIVDLKTFENMMGMEVKRAIARAIASLKYHVQVAFYFQAVEAAKQLIREDKVFAPDGQMPPTEWLQAVAASPDFTFLFVFQQKGKAPVTRGITFTPYHSTIRLGEVEIEMAADTFERMFRKFGFEQWVDPRPLEEIDSDEFPAYIAD